MSEFVELIKVVIQNPSSGIVVFAICVFLIFKVKDLLQIFLDIKDLNKKRLMQKFEETYTFHEKSFLDDAMKANYERLCEEAQLKALIGCPYCSREIAQYILSRKHITRAIRIYHRIKDDIEFKDGVLINKLNMPNWRIKVNDIGGSIFYFLILFSGIFPYLLGGLVTLFKIAPSPNFDYYLNAIIIFILALIIGFYLLLISTKPEFAKAFCELEAQPINEAEHESEVVKIDDKVA